MTRRELTIGQRLGSLVVLALAVRVSKTGKRYCRVRCDCGKEKEICHQQILECDTFSCGCGPKGPVPKKGTLSINGGPKICRRCQREFPPSFFRKKKVNPDGLSCYCLTCDSAQTRYYRYGITPVEFEELYQHQEGKCASCNDLMDARTEKNCQVDHDHRTGVVRALLCFDCNAALGRLHDDLSRIEALAHYCRTFCDPNDTEGRRVAQPKRSGYHNPFRTKPVPRREGKE